MVWEKFGDVWVREDLEMTGCHRPSSFYVFYFFFSFSSFFLVFCHGVLPLAVLDLYWECVSGLVVC